MNALRAGSAVAGALAAVAAGAPQEARGVTISVTDTALVYRAEPGELNRASVQELDGGGFRILDSSDRFPGFEPAPLDVQEPCRLRRANAPGARSASVFGFRRARAAHGFPAEVECPARPAVVADLGDYDDGFSVESQLTASARVDGGPGGDAIATGSGADVVLGGDGRDQLAGGRGADRLDGGPAVDVARYDFDDRRLGVHVALGGGDDAGSAEDGPPAARDTLASIESVSGTTFADSLVGDRGANELIGNQGDDRIAGGRGADVVTAGPGRDRIHAGPGGDRVDSRDGEPDRIRCDGGRLGRGDDDVSADPNDRTADDCDSVSVAEPGVLGQPLTIDRRATVSRHGAVLLRLSCVVLVRCRGVLRLTTAAGERLGRRAFTIPAERSGTVVVRPPPDRRRRLRAARATVLTAVLVSRDYAGTRVRTTRRLIATPQRGTG